MSKASSQYAALLKLRDRLVADCVKCYTRYGLQPIALTSSPIPTVLAAQMEHSIRQLTDDLDTIEEISKWLAEIEAGGKELRLPPIYTQPLPEHDSSSLRHFVNSGVPSATTNSAVLPFFSSREYAPGMAAFAT